MNDHASINEDDLAARASGGCEKSFRYLFEYYYPLIHSYAWKLCGDSAAADDIAQQTFIKAASALRGHHKVSRFKPWIYRVALNTARDHQRALSRYQQRLDQLETPLPQDLADLGTYERLTELLSQLSSTIRETVLLVFAQGLTHKEAAHVLECPEGTVAWRISEARKILKQISPTSNE